MSFPLRTTWLTRDSLLTQTFVRLHVRVIPDGDLDFSVDQLLPLQIAENVFEHPNRVVRWLFHARGEGSIPPVKLKLRFIATLFRENVLFMG